MGILKGRISSPLEAGVSLVDSQKLPPQLDGALGFVSERLMRKRLHLTLIVSRNQAPEALSTASPSPPSTTSLFPKNIKWHSKTASLRSMASTSTISSTYTAQTTLSPPLTPLTPMSPMSPRFASGNEYGISLMHTTTLNDKASRHLHESIAKATKKYKLGPGWLTAPSTINALTDETIRHSLQQNEIVFSSEGLTLLALDRVYTCKLAISKYSVSQNQDKNEQLSNAVNELRLLILLHNGRMISDTFLFDTYSNLSISTMEMRAVNAAYRQRFQIDGIAMAPEPIPRVMPSFATRMASPLENTIQARTPGIKLTIPGERQFEQPRMKTPPTPLKIPGFEAAEIKLGETAKSPGFQIPLASPSKIVRLSQWLPRGRGPMTPNNYADVTPITRSEWGHFMGGRQGGNLAAIQTF